MTSLSRRGLLASAGAVVACRVSNALASPIASAASRTAIDTLCTSATPEEIRSALAGGLTAAVVDLKIYPRDPDNAVKEMAAWSERFRAGEEPIALVGVASDFDSARRAHRLGIVLACQDASILGLPGADYEDRLSMLHALGLRILQVTHNDRTPWGDSYMEARDGGLSHAGEGLVTAMNARRMILDLSHCSRQTLFDAVARSTLPCAVTHAGCYALARTARNKRDDEIRALGDKGGFFGVFNMGCWLAEKDPATLADVVAHIDHAIQLVGPKQVGFGSDGSVAQLNAAEELTRMQHVQAAHAGGPSAEWPVRLVRVPELNAPNRLDALAQALAARGHDDVTVRGVMGENFVRFFARVCG